LGFDLGCIDLTGFVSCDLTSWLLIQDPSTLHSPQWVEGKSLEVAIFARLWILEMCLSGNLKIPVIQLQFVSMGSGDDVLILDFGKGESVLTALGDIDRQICLNCGPVHSLWNDPKFDLQEFRSVMSSPGATYSRRDPESAEDDFDLIFVSQ
jgi:hypothetical protein